jgi:hypothetical protein
VFALIRAAARSFGFNRCRFSFVLRRLMLRGLPLFITTYSV